MNKQYKVSQEMLAALEQRRKELQFSLQQEIPQMLEEARALGDLSENLEYQYARDMEWSYINQIDHIDSILSRAVIVDADGTEAPCHDVPEHSQLPAALPVSGQCGKNVFWRVEDRVLYISGTGPMADFETATLPWDGHGTLRRIVIEEGVTSIGSHSFANMEVDEIQIPDSVTTISDWSFFNASVGRLELKDTIQALGSSIIAGDPCGIGTLIVSVDIPHIEEGAFYSKFGTPGEIILRGTLPEDLYRLIHSELFAFLPDRLYYPREWDTEETTFYDKIAAEIADCGGIKHLDAYCESEFRILRSRMIPLDPDSGVVPSLTGNPCRWDDARDFHDGLALVTRDGKDGFIDRTGNLVIPCRWNVAENFCEGLALASNSVGEEGYIDKTGALVIPYRWESPWDIAFHEGMARAELDRKWGFIDKTGSLKIPCQWDDARDFHEGMALVKRDGKYGFIDEYGHPVIPCQWDQADSFHEGLARVQKDGKWGFLDRNGTLVIPCQWEEARNYCDGLAIVKGWGYFYSFINTSGEDVLTFECESLLAFSEGLAAIEDLDNTWNFVDRAGNTLCPCQWDDAWPFREGMALVKRDGKYGFIDKTGALAIPCQWDQADSFHEGLARVQKDGKWGFLDKRGILLLPCQWDEAYSFREGLAIVKCRNLYDFIDHTGRVLGEKH